MIEKDAYSLVSEILRPQSFYEHRHQLLFTAITNLALKQQPIDLLTVKNELEREGTLDEVGGPFYITQLTSKVANHANHSVIVGCECDCLDSRGVTSHWTYCLFRESDGFSGIGGQHHQPV